MQKTTKRYRDLTEEERLEHNRKIMELRRNGLWEQIHGIVLPKENTQQNRQDTNK